MSNNSFRGFGAIPQSDSMMANRPGITPLNKQYIDNLNGYWPGANTFSGFAAAGTSPYFLQIYQKIGTTNSYDKLLTPSTAPTAVSLGMTYSPNGKFLVLSFNVTPYVYIYKREGEIFTKLSNPSTLPAGGSRGVAFSPDNTYLVVGHATTPYMTIYKIDGDTFTKISNPSTLPSGTTVQSTAFSPDGQYLAIGVNASPWINVYKVDSSTDTFTKLTGIPTALSGAVVGGLAWSSDSVYLMYAGGGIPSYGGYKVTTGDTFTALTIGTTPSGTGQVMEFSPDNTYLAIGTTTNFAIVKRSGDTFTILTGQPASMPAGETNSISWSADGNYMLVGGINDPIIIYSRSGDTFTKIADTNIQNNLATSSVQGGLVWFNSP